MYQQFIYIISIQKLKSGCDQISAKYIIFFGAPYFGDPFFGMSHPKSNCNELHSCQANFFQYSLTKSLYFKTKISLTKVLEYMRVRAKKNNLRAIEKWFSF